jgi:D-alanyl-D-alanine carboxypeptidase
VHAPPFVATIAPVTAVELGKSWHASCPVGPSELRRVQLRFVGFDGETHTGSLVVSRAVTSDVIAAFGALYAQRFPIRRIRPVAAYGGSDERSMAADNTSAFNCRYAVTAGPKRWSVHAYGEAIDVNPVENPYLEGGRVRPAAGKRFLDRASARAGMAVAGGVLVRAFAAIGWQWGGRWSGTPDYQHFSANGR